MEKYEYEIINGKPHFGQWFGRYISIPNDAFVGDPDKNILLKECKEKIEQVIIPIDLEVRHKQFIVRPPSAFCMGFPYGTLAIKFMLWGRAFKVQKLCKKGVKRYKKVHVNGRLKRRRIDR